jgi:hypothetical protein
MFCSILSFSIPITSTGYFSAFCGKENTLFTQIGLLRLLPTFLPRQKIIEETKIPDLLLTYPSSEKSSPRGLPLCIEERERIIHTTSIRFVNRKENNKNTKKWGLKERKTEPVSTHKKTKENHKKVKGNKREYNCGCWLLRNWIERGVDEMSFFYGRIRGRLRTCKWSYILQTPKRKTPERSRD